MARSMSFTIPIDPIPWQRPGLNGKHFFDKQHKEKLVFNIYINQQLHGQPIFSKAVKMTMLFCMPTPKYLLKCKALPPHDKKPDLDNLEKFLLDSISHGILLADDCIVCSVSKDKVYDKNPRTEFTITEVL
jgi:Holliday junction resolvase RusA-like endonuclease